LITQYNSSHTPQWANQYHKNLCESVT